MKQVHVIVACIPWNEIKLPVFVDLNYPAHSDVSRVDNLGQEGLVFLYVILYLCLIEHWILLKFIHLLKMPLVLSAWISFQHFASPINFDEPSESLSILCFA